MSPLDVISSPRESLRTCEKIPYFPQQIPLQCITYYFMTVENGSMESSEDEAQLGMESEDENSELSDGEVRVRLSC